MVRRNPISEMDELLHQVPDKMGVGNGLTLTVKVESRPEGGLSPQRLEEIRSALRELGLDDRIH